ncbi:MAG: HAD family hydrolase [Anaerolineales bacterium]
MPAKPVPVFDIGGVVIDWNPRHLFRKFFPGDPESMERFLREVNFRDWNAGMDLGRPFADGVADASARLPRYADLLRTFDERWEETAAGPIPGMPELLGRLHERGNILYGISNSSCEKFPILRKNFAFLRLFSDILLSGEVGVNKPDPRIFLMFLKRTGLSREEVLFIDDTAANVEAARRLGWDAVIFTSVRNLESVFSARGLL